MVSIFSLKFLLALLNLFPLAFYLVLLNYFTKVFFLFFKRADFVALVFGASYIFIFKYILFEYANFWSEIFPYILLLFLLFKFMLLRKILSLPILVLSIAVTAIYPMAYFFNVIDMTYHPYIVFVYHSFWVGVFMYCAKRLKEGEKKVSKI